jgi:peptidyl-prolyl cis-trans isomerase A (cyclophilin A)
MIKRHPHIRRGIAVLLSGLLVTLCLAQEATPPAEAAPPPAAPAATAPPVEAPKLAPALTTVVIHTTMGDIEVALEIERAPITAKNFLRYVDSKRFDNMNFYRALKLTEDGKYGLVQGGLQNDPKRVYPKIAHESPVNTGVSHVDGAISMGRNEPGTAQADFFFTIGDLKSMDGKADGTDPGYAAFGHVTAGMDVVRAIVELPKSQEARSAAMKGQMLATPVKILTVRRKP